tara:strand:+ start:219 stop:551 length:333 start_codon:yes stop_codon:yes gene_type:complete
MPVDYTITRMMADGTVHARFYRGDMVTIEDRSGQVAPYTEPANGTIQAYERVELLDEKTFNTSRYTHEDIRDFLDVELKRYETSTDKAIPEQSTEVRNISSIRKRDKARG